MRGSEILRRRVAALLKETEALPSLESILATGLSERADAMTATWHARHRWHELGRDLESRVEYGSRRSTWAGVAASARELTGRLKRYDRCVADILALMRRSIADCAAALRDAEELRIEDARGSKLGGLGR